MITDSVLNAIQNLSVFYIPDFFLPALLISTISLTTSAWKEALSSRLPTAFTTDDRLLVFLGYRLKSPREGC